MIVALFNTYLVILFGLVKLRIVPFNLFWKVSPAIVLVLLLFGLFIPMGWGAPSGPAVVIRPSVPIVADVAGEVIDVPVAANAPLRAGDVLFRIDPLPYQSQVDALAAQLRFEELRLAQMTSSSAPRPAAPSMCSSARRRSSSSRPRSRAPDGTSTRPSCAHRPMAMSPTSPCARGRVWPTCRCRRSWPSSTRPTP